jgi:type IV secretory pathway VirB10-like protein
MASSTYFAWPQQADLPAVFVVGADGVEGLANAVVRDGYLVVDQLAPRFVLRSRQGQPDRHQRRVSPRKPPDDRSAPVRPDRRRSRRRRRPGASVGGPRPCRPADAVIMAGFGLMGVGPLPVDVSHRADAQPRPQHAIQAVASAPATLATTPAAAPVIPGPQFTENNSLPPTPAQIAAMSAAPLPPTPTVDMGQRRRAPTLVVDFGGAPALIKASVDTGQAATAGKPTDAGLNADEKFADRVGTSDAEPAKATAMRDLDVVVPQGAVIPAVMETAINSDLPGLARAMVTRDIKSFDGSTVLIPRGSRVIGQYKSGVAMGASRVFVIWTRVIRPDGVSIQIASPAADPLGRGGLEGKVDRHFFGRFGGSILMSVLNAGVAAVSNARAPRRSISARPPRRPTWPARSQDRPRRRPDDPDARRARR